MRGLTWRGWLLALLIAAMALTMVGLGLWQLDRLAQRRAQNALVAERLAGPPVDLNTFAPGDLPEYQPVRLSGTFDFSQEIVLRNRAHLNSPGVRVLTPLRLTGTDYAVLVDRGWIPYTEAEPAARAAYQQPASPVTLEGIVRPSQQREFAFLPADPTLSPAQPRLDAWFRINVDQIQAQVPYPLLPFYVEAAAGLNPSRLPISGYELDLTEGPHLGYAIQWFAFAAILVIGSLALYRQRLARPG
jgi:surfeit locus 1 family protein